MKLSEFWRNIFEYLKELPYKERIKVVHQWRERLRRNPKWIQGIKEGYYNEEGEWTTDPKRKTITLGIKQIREFAEDLDELLSILPTLSKEESNLVILEFLENIDTFLREKTELDEKLANEFMVFIKDIKGK